MRAFLTIWIGAVLLAATDSPAMLVLLVPAALIWVVYVVAQARR